jgi:hypothetical protein
MVGLAASIIWLVVESLIGKPATAEQLASVAAKPLEGVEIFDLAKSHIFRSVYLKDPQTRYCRSRFGNIVQAGLQQILLNGFVRKIDGNTG